MAFSLVKAPNMPGPDGKCFLLQGSKGSSRVLCPPASSFSPEAGGNQNAAYLWGAPAGGPVAPTAAQASSRLLPPLWAGPSSQR